MLKFIIGLILLPICWVSLETFFLLFKKEALSGSFYNSPEFFFFSVGAALSLLVFFGARRHPVLMWLYVAGHELTHAFFVLIFRGEVSRIHITSEGGHILTNRNNFLISLSPYLVPFYTLLFLLGWALFEWQWVDFEGSDFFWFYGIIGLTWMFHVAYTIWMLQRDQNDIELNGRLFSFTVIFLGNVTIISFLMILASPNVSFAGFGDAWLHNLETLVSRIVTSVRELTS